MSKQEEEMKQVTLVVSIVAMLMLFGLALGFADCQWSQHRRQECIEQTRDINGCRSAFPVHGDHIDDR